jgi:hypothetical protein
MERAAGPGATAPGLIFLAPKLGPGTLGPLIVDNAGDAVWVHPVGAVTTDLRVQQYDGIPVLTWWEGKSANGYGEGSFVVMDDSYTEVGRIKAGNGLDADLHDLRITPEGTALFGAYAVLPPAQASVQGRPVLESVVQEVDIATGRVLFEWHSHDHVDVAESYSEPMPKTAQPFDYFHLNSIEVAGDHLLVSARNTHAVYKVSRADGSIAWRLGGKKSDFDMGPRTAFAWQHDVRQPEPGVITMFDNSASPKVANHSRGLVLSVDESALTAAFGREYVHPSKLSSGSQGDLQTLPGGGAFVGWGFAPRYSEYGPDGSLVLDAKFTGGGQSYRAVRLPWVGRPAEPPRVSLEVSNDKRPTVYASWNGATETAAWRVAAGSQPDSLADVATAPRAGFETAIPLKALPAYVAVSALDQSGTVLGTSNTVGR